MICQCGQKTDISTCAYKRIPHSPCRWSLSFKLGFSPESLGSWESCAVYQLFLGLESSGQRSQTDPFSQCGSLRPSVSFVLHPSGSREGLSLSQLSQGEKRGTPWTTCPLSWGYHRETDNHSLSHFQKSTTLCWLDNCNFKPLLALTLE